MGIERTRNFIILHYHATARTGPFWERARAMPIASNLAERIALFAETGRIRREHNEMFAEAAWLQVR